jgi:hypothetical protein
MKKKRAIVLAAIAFVVLLAGVYLWGPGTTPPGQEPLLAVSSANFNEFEKAFNADADVPRLVLLLSPT